MVQTQMRPAEHCPRLGRPDSGVSFLSNPLRVISEQSSTFSLSIHIEPYRVLVGSEQSRGTFPRPLTRDPNLRGFEMRLVLVTQDALSQGRQGRAGFQFWANHGNWPETRITE